MSTMENVTEPQYAIRFDAGAASSIFSSEKRLVVCDEPLEKASEQPYYVMVENQIVGAVRLGHGFKFSDIEEYRLTSSLHCEDNWVEGSHGHRVVESALFDSPTPVHVADINDDDVIVAVEKMSIIVTASVWKSVIEERVVAAAVLVPGRTDLHDEIYNAETTRAAAYYFMEHYLQDDDHGIDVMHNNEIVPDAIRVLQSFVLDEEKTYTIEVPVLDDDNETKKMSEITFPAGTWIMYARVISDTLWEGVKDGEFTGWSIAGLARVRELRKLLKAA